MTHKQSDYVKGSQQLVDVLGVWPVFHDAQVIAFSVQRPLNSAEGAPLAPLSLHVTTWKYIGVGTADFEQVVDKSLLVNFLFEGTRDCEVAGFNHQNVIDQLAVSRIEADDNATLRGDIESIWGVGGWIRCQAVVLESVQVLHDRSH